MTNTKGTKIQGLYKVIQKGSSCVGCMSWETSFVFLEDLNGTKYFWQGDHTENLYRNQMIYIHSAFAYATYNEDEEQNVVSNLKKVKFEIKPLMGIFNIIA